MPSTYHCANCDAKACAKGGVYPVGCPTAEASGVTSQALTSARDDAMTLRVLAAAATTPRTPDGTMRTRVEETIALCRQMGWTKIGVAFCLMLAKEARMLCAQLEQAGFEVVVPVCCKVGAVGLADQGVAEACPTQKGACNPMAQAALMNEQQTDLNIMLGLCVGHDILFNKYSQSPVTTLAVKDRALRHNPLEALRPA